VRYIGPARILLKGESADKFIALARTQMGKMLNIMRGLNLSQHVMRRTYPIEGVHIETRVALPAVYNIGITVLGSSDEEVTVLDHGFIYVPGSFPEQYHIIAKNKNPNEEDGWTLLTADEGDYSNRFPVPSVYGNLAHWTGDNDLLTIDSDSIYSQGYKVAEKPVDCARLYAAWVRDEHIYAFTQCGVEYQILKRKLARGENVGGDRYDATNFPEGWTTWSSMPSADLPVAINLEKASLTEDARLFVTGLRDGDDWIDVELTAGDMSVARTTAAVVGKPVPRIFQTGSLTVVEDTSRFYRGTVIGGATAYPFSTNRFAAGNSVQEFQLQTTSEVDSFVEYDNGVSSVTVTFSEQVVVSMHATVGGGSPLLIGSQRRTGTINGSVPYTIPPEFEPGNPDFEARWDSWVNENTTTTYLNIVGGAAVEVYERWGIITVLEPASPSFTFTDDPAETLGRVKFSVIDVQSGGVLFSKAYPDTYNISFTSLAPGSSPESCLVTKDPESEQGDIYGILPGPDRVLSAESDYTSYQTADCEANAGSVDFSTDADIRLVSFARLPDGSASGIVFENDNFEGFLVNPEGDVATFSPESIAFGESSTSLGVYPL
jgi:hypothetical protein